MLGVNVPILYLSWMKMGGKWRETLNKIVIWPSQLTDINPVEDLWEILEQHVTPCVHRMRQVSSM